MSIRGAMAGSIIMTKAAECGTPKTWFSENAHRAMRAFGSDSWRTAGQRANLVIGWICGLGSPLEGKQLYAGIDSINKSTARRSSVSSRLA
jgi:hypothetical protein